MNLSALISGSASILIGVIIMIESEFKAVITYSLFIIIGIAIIVYSEKADMIEKIKRVKK